MRVATDIPDYVRQTLEEVPKAAEPIAVATAAPAAAPVEPALPAMKERYASAAAATKETGVAVHVAQFEPYEGIPDALLPAMSQVSARSPLHAQDLRSARGRRRTGMARTSPSR